MGKKSSDVETIAPVNANGSVGTLTGDGTPIIAAAAMTAVGKARLGSGPHTQNASAAYIADCQIEAMQQAQAAGVHDPAKLREAKIKAKRIAEGQLQAAIDAVIKETADAAAKLGNTPAA